MAYVGSVVSVISYPPKSLLIFLQGFDVNKVRAEADAKYVLRSQVMHSEMGKPTCICPAGACSWVKWFFLSGLSCYLYMRDWFCSPSGGFPPLKNTLKKGKYCLNKLMLRKPVAEMVSSLSSCLFFFLF